MATDDDAPAPAYTEQDAPDSLWAWIDSMAARAAELGLPLTHGARSQYPALNCKPLLRDPYAEESTEPVFEPGEAGVAAAAAAAQTSERAVLRQQIVDGFFRAVRGGLVDVVTRYVTQGLVSPDVHEGATTAMMYGEGADPADRDGDDNPEDDRFDFMLGTTPLLAAVAAGRMAMVRTLLALGADADRLGVPSGFAAERAVVQAASVWQGATLAARQGIPPPWLPPWDKEHMSSTDTRLAIERARRLRRTPLMVAAATGRLAVVELLLLQRRRGDETAAAAATAAAADDAIVAPDGQTALRLAVTAGHRDIVAVLPVRRGGASRRFRMRHAAAMARARRAGRPLVMAARVVGWQLPKLVVWDAPGLVVELVQRSGDVAGFVRRAGRTVVRVVADVAKTLSKLLAKLPTALGEAGHWLVADMPRGLVRMLRAAGQALLRLAAWAGHAVGGLGGVLARAVLATAAAVHTAAVAAATWLRVATLADVARGLRTAAAALFVGLPLWLVHVLRQLGTTTADALASVFGSLGRAVVALTRHLTSLLLFVPKQLGRLAAAGGSSVAAAAHEAAVFVNPKR